MAETLLPVPKEDYIEAAVLHDMYTTQLNSNNRWAADSFSWRMFSQGFEVAEIIVEEHEIDLVLRGLEAKGYVTGIHDPYARSRWKITDGGRAYVESLVSAENSIISNYAELGRDWIIEVFQSIKKAQNPFGTPDDEDDTEDDGAENLESFDTATELWEPLPIETASKEYEEALAAASDAEERIRKDNGFAASYPAIRETIVWTLGSGVNRLREGLITLSQVRSLLIAPLTKITQMFAEGLLRAAAQRAIEKLIALLSSIGG